MSSVIIDLQIATTTRVSDLPTHSQLQHWAVLTLADQPLTEIGIRLVDHAESAQLNKIYRNKSGSTNVLSFPFTTDYSAENLYLGDLVLCAPLIIKEANEQGKSVVSHFAHLVIHGILHLLGYDHIVATDAEIMETKEKAVMAAAGFSNPYQELH